MSRLTLTASLVTCSLVAATVSSLGSSALADVAYVPAAGAPMMSREPAVVAPAPQRERRVPYRPRPVPRPQPAQPEPHYAQPPPDTSVSNDEPPVMDRAQLRVVLRAARKRNLAAFIAYEKTGVFPSNTYDNGALNVWRDRDGHLCAAATIISKSGATELVDRVADQNNFIKLADIKQGPVMDWILTSGFTQEELVAIQKPFNPVAQPTVQPIPPPVPTVDPDMRTAENKRLAKIYKDVEKQLVHDEAKSLDAAADRLYKHPTLAWTALGY